MKHFIASLRANLLTDLGQIINLPLALGTLSASIYLFLDRDYIQKLLTNALKMDDGFIVEVKSRLNEISKNIINGEIPEDRYHDVLKIAEASFKKIYFHNIYLAVIKILINYKLQAQTAKRLSRRNL